MSPLVIDQLKSDFRRLEDFAPRMRTRRNWRPIFIVRYLQNSKQCWCTEKYKTMQHSRKRLTSLALEAPRIYFIGFHPDARSLRDIDKPSSLRAMLKNLKKHFNIIYSAIIMCKYWILRLTAISSLSTHVFPKKRTNCQLMTIVHKKSSEIRVNDRFQEERRRNYGELCASKKDAEVQTFGEKNLRQDKIKQKLKPVNEKNHNKNSRLPVRIRNKSNVEYIKVNSQLSETDALLGTLCVKQSSSSDSQKYEERPLLALDNVKKNMKHKSKCIVTKMFTKYNANRTNRTSSRGKKFSKNIKETIKENNRHKRMQKILPAKSINTDKEQESRGECNSTFVVNGSSKSERISESVERTFKKLDDHCKKIREISHANNVNDEIQIFSKKNLKDTTISSTDPEQISSYRLTKNNKETQRSPIRAKSYSKYCSRQISTEGPTVLGKSKYKINEQKTESEAAILRDIRERIDKDFCYSLLSNKDKMEDFALTEDVTDNINEMIEKSKFTPSNFDQTERRPQNSMSALSERLNKNSTIPQYQSCTQYSCWASFTSPRETKNQVDRKITNQSATGRCLNIGHKNSKYDQEYDLSGEYLNRGLKRIDHCPSWHFESDYNYSTAKYLAEYKCKRYLLKKFLADAMSQTEDTSEKSDIQGAADKTCKRESVKSSKGKEKELPVHLEEQCRIDPALETWKSMSWLVSSTDSGVCINSPSMTDLCPQENDDELKTKPSCVRNIDGSFVFLPDRAVETLCQKTEKITDLFSKQLTFFDEKLRSSSKSSKLKESDDIPFVPYCSYDLPDGSEEEISFDMSMPSSLTLSCHSDEIISEDHEAPVDLSIRIKTFTNRVH